MSGSVIPEFSIYNTCMTTRKQHYVPRAYLKYFSINEKNSFSTYVLDKNGKIFKTNIENIACERDFYEIKNPTIEVFKEPNYIEKTFSNNYENKIPDVFNKLIAISKLANNESVILYKSLKIEISKLIVVQLFRTKKGLSYFDSIVNDYKNNTIASIMPYEKYFTPKIVEQINEIKNNNQFFKDAEFEELFSDDLMNLLTNILCNKTWCLYKNINTRNCQFITSDHPVVSFNRFSESFELKDNGVGRIGTYIYYPIASDLILFIYPSDLYFGVINKNNNKIFFINDDEFVNKINLQQYEQCFNQVYSPNIKMLENMINSK